MFYKLRYLYHNYWLHFHNESRFHHYARRDYHLIKYREIEARMNPNLKAIDPDDFKMEDLHNLKDEESLKIGKLRVKLYSDTYLVFDSGGNMKKAGHDEEVFTYLKGFYR